MTPRGRSLEILVPIASLACSDGVGEAWPEWEGVKGSGKEWVHYYTNTTTILLPLLCENEEWDEWEGARGGEDGK
jgi:hypothetical protein